MEDQACGLDNIKAEKFKAAPAICISALTKLLNKIMNEQKPTKNITDGNLTFCKNPINQKELSKVSDL